jgi:hypothetical protein
MNEVVEYFCNLCHTQAKGEISFESFINTENSLVKIVFPECKHVRTIIMKNGELEAIKKGFKKSLCGRGFITPHTAKQIQKMSLHQTTKRF